MTKNGYKMKNQIDGVKRCRGGSKIMDRKKLSWLWPARIILVVLEGVVSTSKWPKNGASLA